MPESCHSKKQKKNKFKRGNAIWSLLHDREEDQAALYRQININMNLILIVFCDEVFKNIDNKINIKEPFIEVAECVKSPENIDQALPLQKNESQVAKSFKTVPNQFFMVKDVQIVTVVVLNVKAHIRIWDMWVIPPISNSGEEISHEWRQ